jgi:hypothetical protein
MENVHPKFNQRPQTQKIKDTVLLSRIQSTAIDTQ